MQRRDTELDGVCILAPEVHTDRRGFFMESYNRRTFSRLGVPHEFVQDNHSRSTRGVLRGLHYQIDSPQAKLVRVTLGTVFDVVVDVRRGSPTFGRWLGRELSSDNRLMLFAPEGFAHGFLVLSEVAEFQYKCSDFYTPEAERGIAWDDPDLAITWPLPEGGPILSRRDAGWPTLRSAAQADLPEYGS